MTKQAPRTWSVHCHDFGPDAVTRYQHFGEPSYVKRYGAAHPIVAVLLVEDEHGPYLGWLKTGSDQVTSVLRERIFDIQFPDGHQDAVARGKGEAIPLRIEPLV